METDKQPSPGNYTLPTIRFAKLVGVTEKRLRQIADDGHIPQPIHGMWDEDNCLAGIIAYYRQRKERVQGDDDAAKKLRAEREIVELKLAKLRGSNADVAALEKVWGAITTTVRQKVSGLGSRLSPRAQFWRDQQEAEKDIQKECDEALEALSDPSAYNFKEATSDEPDDEDTEEGET